VYDEETSAGPSTSATENGVKVKSRYRYGNGMQTGRIGRNRRCFKRHSHFSVFLVTRQAKLSKSVRKVDPEKFVSTA
jgi:hypothetical protein